MTKITNSEIIWRALEEYGEHGDGHSGWLRLTWEATFGDEFVEALVLVGGLVLFARYPHIAAAVQAFQQIRDAI